LDGESRPAIPSSHGADVIQSTASVVPPPEARPTPPRPAGCRSVTQAGGAWHEASSGEPEQRALKAKRAIAGRIVDAKKASL
jgi:hypothetical protein